MLYELRFYSITPGRMRDVHARFNKHLPELFSQHGINCAGYWSALSGPRAPRFVYLLAHDDFVHREASWGSFYADPEWARIRAETNAGHEMVERADLYFLKPNAAWTVDPDAGNEPIGSFHELVLQQVQPGQQAATHQFLTEIYLPALQRSGAHNLAILDMASGTEMPQILLLNAWEDAQSWHQGCRALDNDEALYTELASQRKLLGNPLFGRSEVSLLEPGPGALITPSLGRR